MSKVVRCVPPLPSTERGTKTQIKFDSSGEKVLYCNQNNIIWRPVQQLLEGDAKEKPEDIYCDRRHARATTTVAMSPNGNWVISGDATGKVVLWGSKGEHTQKGEYQLWNGPVKEIEWSSDSTRLAACGDGKETKAAAFIWDTGSKTGSVEGHAKCINSISFRSQRPFRIITGSEDQSIRFHEGVPFKFMNADNSHTNSVNWVGFSPDGEWAASAGSDSKLILFTGKDAQLVKEFKKPEDISGSIWDAAWSPDSARIVTAGGDKKLRVWDREAGAQVSVFALDAAFLENQQVGVSWVTATTIASLCLDGRINFFDVAADGTLTLKKCVDGTQGPLKCLAREGQSGTLCAGSSDGTFAIIPAGGASLKVKVGKTIQHVLCHNLTKEEDEGSKSDETWVITMDDCVRRYSLSTGSLVGDPVEVKEFTSGAGWLDQLETSIIVATSKGNLKCISDKEVKWTKAGAIPRRATACTTLKGSRIAVAVEKLKAADPAPIYIFRIDDASSPDGIVEETVLMNGHAEDVMALCFSPDGDFLASCDSGRVINIWCLKDGYTPMKFIGLHNARVCGLGWLPSGQLVSCALDQNIIIWDVNYSAKEVKENSKLCGKGTSCLSAHRGGTNALVMCGASEFASVGEDGFLLMHSLP